MRQYAVATEQKGQEETGSVEEELQRLTVSLGFGLSLGQSSQGHGLHALICTEGPWALLEHSPLRMSPAHQIFSQSNFENPARKVSQKTCTLNFQFHKTVLLVMSFILLKGYCDESSFALTLPYISQNQNSIPWKRILL